MTRDEHRNIIAFIEEAVRPAAPMDVEADAIIRALFVRNPEAAYRVTRLAMAQRDKLAELKLELAEAKARLEKHWLARLLGKPGRRTPDLSILPQNIR